MARAAGRARPLEPRVSPSRRTLAGLRTFALRRFGCEAPGSAVDDDPARRRPREVRAERLGGVVVETRAHVRVGALHGVVHEVAGDDGFGASRADADADVARR